MQSDGVEEGARERWREIVSRGNKVRTGKNTDYAWERTKEWKRAKKITNKVVEAICSEKGQQREDKGDSYEWRGRHKSGDGLELWQDCLLTVHSVLLPLKAETLKASIPMELDLLDCIIFSAQLICGNEQLFWHLDAQVIVIECFIVPCVNSMFKPQNLWVCVDTFFLRVFFQALSSSHWLDWIWL